MGVPQNHPFIDAYSIISHPQIDQSHAAQAVNLSEFYESSAWVAKQLAVPLRPSSFGRRYADALHEAGVTRRCGKETGKYVIGPPKWMV